MTETPVTLGWIRHAACRGVDPDLFFPTRGGDVRAAKKVCAGCEVRAECLDYALTEHLTHGIFGGTSERERRRLRRNMPKTPPPINHGTISGAQAHRRRGERPCTECLDANARYMEGRRHPEVVE